MIQLTVKVIPRASKPGIAGIRNGALLVRLRSPPVEGAANTELIEMIAKVFGLATRDVSIASGERSKLKRISLGTLDRNGVDAILRSLGIDASGLFP